MSTNEPHFVVNISTVVNTANRGGYVSDVSEWCKTILVIYMVFIAILAVIGNGIIILVERNNRFKTSTDWLVCFMAANDLIYVMFEIPIHISLQLETWTFCGSGALCKGHKFIGRVTMYSSALLLCIVALDRYWKTCRPHAKFLTPERAFKICIFETFVSCAIVLPIPASVEYDGANLCVAIDVDSAITKAVTGIISVTYVVMFIIVGVCYTKVALTIRSKLIRTQDDGEPRRKEKRNDQPSANQPKVNSDSAKTSVKWPRGRNSKIHPIVESNSSTRESKLISATIQRSKEEAFSENTDGHPCAITNGRLSNPDQEPQTCGTKVQGNVKRSVLLDSRVNRTTKIMFAVTLVFLCSWIPTWFVIVYNQMNDTNKSVRWKIFATFGEKSFMLNTFTNPIFYIWLSTVFKQRAKQLVKNLFICRKRGHRK